MAGERHGHGMLCVTRPFLVPFVFKEQGTCPVFKLQSAVRSRLEGNYQNSQPKYQTTAVHNHLSSWSPVYRQNILYDTEVEFCNVKLLTQRGSSWMSPLFHDHPQWKYRIYLTAIHPQKQFYNFNLLTRSAIYSGSRHMPERTLGVRNWLTNLKTSNNSGFNYYQIIFTAKEFLSIQRQWIHSDRNPNVETQYFLLSPS